MIVEKNQGEKNDIESREDLMLLVRHFYELMLKDEMLAPIFTDVAKIDLEKHLPHLVDFWHSLLFRTGEYRRNVMNMHIDLHLKSALEKKHFDRWLSYFRQSINQFFEGPRSTEAIERATSIALLMQVKIGQVDNMI
jgi:hemoglobin